MSLDFLSLGIPVAQHESNLKNATSEAFQQVIEKQKIVVQQAHSF
jgi:flagellar biosynthesis regulator FlaF